MKSYLVAGIAAVALSTVGSSAFASAPASAPPAPSTADAQFKSIYTREWDWREAEFGRIDEEGGESKRNDTLPHVDAASQVRRLAYWDDVLKSLAAVDPKSLSPDEKINYLVYKDQIFDLAAEQRFRTYEAPFNSDSQFWADLAPSAGRSWRTAAEYHAYLGRLRDLPRLFDEEIDNMRAGLKRSFTAPRATLVGRDKSIADVAAETDPETNIFYAPFKTLPATIPAAEQASLRAEAAKIVREGVVPAHVKLLRFIREDYIPHARDTLAAEALPNGAAYYQQMIHEYTTLDLTPDQIHAIGLSEVARIHTEMLAVMAQTRFKGTFPEFLT